ncbi:MAG: hypothetical protein IPF71_01560 [Rhodoferax sp.]|nr:hypothetical protein [Rhodoferax sp.]
MTVIVGLAAIAALAYLTNAAIKWQAKRKEVHCEVINQTIDLVHVCLALQENVSNPCLGYSADEISGVATARHLEQRQFSQIACEDCTWCRTFDGRKRVRWKQLRWVSLWHFK